MNRNVIIVGAVAVVLVIAAGVLFFIRNGGEMTALARLDAAIAAYDGSYESATYDTGEDRLVVEGLVLREFSLDEDAEPLDLLQIAHIEAVGIARGSLNSVFSGSDEQKILSQLEATGLTLTEAGQSISIDGLVLEDLSIVPLSDAMQSMAALRNDSEPASRAQEAAHLFLTLHVARAELTDFASPEQGPTGIRVGRILVENVAGGEIGSVRFEQFSLWDSGQMGTVGDSLSLNGEEFEVTGLNGQLPLQRLLSGEDLNFQRQTDLPIFSTMILEGIVVNEDGGNPITIGSATVRNDDYVGAMPTATTMSLSGFRVPLDSQFIEPAQVLAIRNLGYDELVFSFAYRYYFDPTTGDFELTGLTLSAEEMGELSLRLMVTDIPFTEEIANMTSEAMAESGYVTEILENGKLGAGELRFNDFGIRDRAMNNSALQVGVTREEYIAQVLTELEAQRQAMASSPAAVQGIDAVISFLSGAESISMTISPDEPVPFTQIAVAAQINPVLLIEMFNVEISAGE